MSLIDSLRLTKRKDSDFLSANEKNELSQKIRKLFLEKSSLFLDQVKMIPSESSVSMLSIDSVGQPDCFFTKGAFWKIIFTYSLSNINLQEISFHWDLFTLNDLKAGSSFSPSTSPALSEVIATVEIFNHKKRIYIFSQEQPFFVLKKENSDLNEKNIRVHTNKTPTWLVLLFSVAIVFLLIGFYLKWVSFKIGVIFIATTLLVINGIPKHFQDTLSSENIKEVLSIHLNRIFKAFEEESENMIYDALEKSVETHLRQEVYSEIYKSLLVNRREGRLMKIYQITILNVKPNPEGNNSGLVDYKVNGFIEHSGHLHHKINQHHAFYTLSAEDGFYKISAWEILSQVSIIDQPIKITSPILLSPI